MAELGGDGAARGRRQCCFLRQPRGKETASAVSDTRQEPTQPALKVYTLILRASPCPVPWIPRRPRPPRPLTVTAVVATPKLLRRRGQAPPLFHATRRHVTRSAATHTGSPADLTSRLPAARASAASLVSGSQHRRKISLLKERPFSSS